MRPWPRATPQRVGGLVLAVVLLAEWAWGLLYIERTSFVHAGERVFCLWDDGMISMQYARNLARGFGLVWNPGGEPVQGFSNLGVTLLMAGLHLLPLPATQLSLAFQLLNLAALSAVLLCVREIALRASGRRQDVAAAALVATALCAPLQLWSLQGSDTGAVAVWLLGALAWLARAQPRWPRGLALYLAAGVLIRPDVGLFAAVFLAASPSFPGDRWRRLVLGGSALAAVVAGLALFGWLYYGDPLPNTYYLKATGSPLGLVLRSGLLELGFWPLGLPTSLPLVAAALLRHRRDRSVWLAAALAGAALAYNLGVGGDWKGEYGSRFVAPVLPLLALLAALGSAALLDAGLRGWTWLRSAAVVAAAAGAALTLSPQLALLDWLDPGREPMLRAANVSNYRAAIYLREHTRPTASIAVHYGGVPPYFSERHAIDVLGKSDRHIAKLRVDRFVPGHSKWDWGYVLSQEPDLILATSRGLGLQPGFRREYRLAVARRADLRFYVRRDSLGALTDPELRLFDPVRGSPIPPSDALDPRRRRPQP